MQVKKIINNNILLTVDPGGSERILMGKGIGFHAKNGGPVDEALVEKTYAITDEWTENKLTQLLREIPLEHLQAANEIISFARVSLGKKLSENLFLTLTDHIHYAICRQEQGIFLKNALLWEIKRFYNHEFLIGKEALRIIQDKLAVELPEDEAGFIALHIVNANLDLAAVSQVSEMAETIQQIMNIVKYHFNTELDEYSLNYERFVTHLKFFMQRLFSGVQLKDPDTVAIMGHLKEQYQKEYACAEKISRYIATLYQRQLQEDELIYLTIHIKRITTEE